jgi:hypothetical protein
MSHFIVNVPFYSFFKPSALEFVLVVVQRLAT